MPRRQSMPHLRRAGEWQIVGQLSRLTFPTQLPDTYTPVTFDLEDDTVVETSALKMSERTRALPMQKLQAYGNAIRPIMTPVETLDVSQCDL